MKKQEAFTGLAVAPIKADLKRGAIVLPEWPDRALFSPVNRSQICRWEEEAAATPPTLFKSKKFDSRDLSRIIRNTRCVTVLEHVCEKYQLWSVAPASMLLRLQFATETRELQAAGERSAIEGSGKRGKRTAGGVVAVVDFLVPVLLAFDVPFGTATGSRMVRALDLLSQDLFGLPSPRFELQRRVRSHRVKLVEMQKAAAERSAWRWNFVGPPKPWPLVWSGLSRDQRAAIRQAVARGLESLKIQPPLDIQPFNRDQ